MPRSSVVKPNPNRQRYRLGGIYVCEEVSSDYDTSTVSAFWRDGSSVYIITEASHRTTPNFLLPEPLETGPGMHLEGGHWPSRHAFMIGKKAICIVRHPCWADSVRWERLNTDYVKQNFPNIRVPTLICDWYDAKEESYFAIFGICEGRTLTSAWKDLSETQSNKLIQYFADVVQTLATHSSKRLSSIIPEEPILDELLHPNALLGPWDQETQLGIFSNFMFPEHNETFCYLYNIDLTPAEIILPTDGDELILPSNDQSIMEQPYEERPLILFWDRLGFFPKFWIATSPFLTTRFWIVHGSNYDQSYGEKLSSKLNALGWPICSNYEQWINLWNTPAPMFEQDSGDSN